MSELKTKRCGTKTGTNIVRGMFGSLDGLEMAREAVEWSPGCGLAPGTMVWDHGHLIRLGRDGRPDWSIG